MNITPSIQELFKELNVEIVLFPSDRRKKFLKVEKFIDYFKNEYSYWLNCSGGKVDSIRQHFITIYNYLNDSSANEDQAIKNLKLAINQAQMNRFPGVYSETVEGKILKDTHTISSIQASVVCEYMFNKAAINYHMLTYDNFLGMMRAYNQKDRDKISEETVEAEKQALSDLSNTYNTQLESLSSEFFSRTEKITKDFDTVQGILKTGQEQFASDTKSLLESSKQRISELEELYEEKLRLQAPATYWNELRKKYIEAGETWRTWSLCTSVGLIIFLTLILYNLPKELFEQFGFNSVKATIVFTLIASIGIYMIRFFVMLSTSAFHLARDANERYQLTYVYLSLLNETGINDTERSIVLQSIFSRADTGLLKGDSSPAFPGMLEQILKNMKK